MILIDFNSINIDVLPALLKAPVYPVYLGYFLISIEFLYIFLKETVLPVTLQEII